MSNRYDLVLEVNGRREAFMHEAGRTPLAAAHRVALRERLGHGRRHDGTETIAAVVLLSWRDSPGKPETINAGAVISI